MVCGPVIYQQAVGSHSHPHSANQIVANCDILLLIIMPIVANSNYTLVDIATDFIVPKQWVFVTTDTVGCSKVSKEKIFGHTWQHIILLQVTACSDWLGVYSPLTIFCPSLFLPLSCLFSFSFFPTLIIVCFFLLHVIVLLPVTFFLSVSLFSLCLCLSVCLSVHSLSLSLWAFFSFVCLTICVSLALSSSSPFCFFLE